MSASSGAGRTPSPASRGYVTTAAPEEAGVIVLTVEEVRRVVPVQQRLRDLVLSAMGARWALLVEMDAGLRLVRWGLSPDTTAAARATRSQRISHGFLDIEEDPQAEALLREVDVSPGADAFGAGGSLTLRNPTNIELAEALHLVLGSPPMDAEMVIVGAGPA